MFNSVAPGPCQTLPTDIPGNSHPSSLNDRFVVYQCNPGFTSDIAQVYICNGGNANGGWLSQEPNMMCTGNIYFGTTEK